MIFNDLHISGANISMVTLFYEYNKSLMSKPHLNSRLNCLSKFFLERPLFSKSKGCLGLLRLTWALLGHTVHTVIDGLFHRISTIQGGGFRPSAADSHG